jgi:glycosyltransferase involved in cell wall biosynthesis
MIKTVGIFHPSLNVCGGAEFVAIELIKILKEENYNIVVLTDDKIDKTKIKKIFDVNLTFDQNIRFPFAFFPSTDLHNLYSDILRCQLLRSKCDFVIDSFSNALLPGAGMSYIHFPFLGRVEDNLRSKLFFSPYSVHSANRKSRSKNLHNTKRIVMANSKYTANAIKGFHNISADVLYPPISSSVFNNDGVISQSNRNDWVVTVARISKRKMLEKIPQIAKLTSEQIKFFIVGLLESEKALDLIFDTIKESGVSARVKVLVNLPKKDLNELLHKSKVYLHPAEGEHFGISIAEAMACGCTPVVHDSGGPREFVSKNLRYLTIEDAAKKTEKAVFEWNPSHSSQMVNDARNFSDEQFSKKFLKIFESHLDRN